MVVRNSRAEVFPKLCMLFLLPGAPCCPPPHRPPSFPNICLSTYSNRSLFFLPTSGWDSHILHRSGRPVAVPQARGISDAGLGWLSGKITWNLKNTLVLWEEGMLVFPCRSMSQVGPFGGMTSANRLWDPRDDDWEDDEVASCRRWACFLFYPALMLYQRNIQHGLWPTYCVCFSDSLGCPHTECVVSGVSLSI